MASSSSSNNNNSSTPNKLTNNYFYYGTHPIKVPNGTSHSSSTQNIVSTTDQHTHFSSLHLTNNHHGYSSASNLPTTQSLNYFPQTSNNDDATSDIFEDAVETFTDDNEDDSKRNHNRKQSSAKHSEEPPMELIQALNESLEISRLFYENHSTEALQKAKTQMNRSIYHSLCYSTIAFMQAGMTFNHDDVEATVQAVRHTSQMAKRFEPYKPWISFNFGAKAVMSEYELHARLVYAEALLIRALLTFMQDQGLLGFISGALKIKECNDIFVKLAKQNDPSRFSSRLSYENFDGGVRMGNGLFNLMISNLPQRIVKYLEFAGFSGDKEYGLTELEKSANGSGLRSTFSAFYLLIYHSFVTQAFGNFDGDLELCQMLIDRFLKLYPNSYLFLFFQARLHTLHSRLDQGIATHRFAMQCQTDWKQLHHIAYWEIIWCHALQREWKQAADTAELLLNENNWSKATYCYLLASFMFEDNHRVATDEIIQLFKKVPGLKIRLAGKSIPLEKYAMRQSEHFLAQQWIFLPALEMIYLLNGFYILAQDSHTLNSTLDTVDNALLELEFNHQHDRFYVDSCGSGLLLRGVLLCFLQRYDEAHEAFDTIIHMGKQFAHKSFLVPTAVFEKALVYIALKQKQKAHEYLHKSLNDYKDYTLESRLQFRINAAMQIVKRMSMDK